ncbi:MAG: acyl carrier protein [Gemmatimonadaceae bacterium]
MTVEYAEVQKFVTEEVASLTGMPEGDVSGDTVLVGAGRVVDSADLVMLLLAVEEFAQDRLNARFDWTSDSAMSEARSIMRTVETLSRHIAQLTPES